MKKFVSGIIVGAILSFSVSAYGAEIQSFIGKEIQGQTTVYKDGEKLDTAIIVDGKSYAPTRSIGEAAGYIVTFEEGEIHLNSANDVVTSPAINESEVAEKIVQIDAAITNRKNRIDSTKIMIGKYKSALDNAESTDSEKQTAAAFLPMEENRLAMLEEQLADLEAEKAALEAQQ